MMDSKKLIEEELREAACFGDVETIKELLLKDVNINSKNDVNGWTALHWAACRGNVEAVSLLLDNGADPTSLTSSGDLPCDLTKSEKVEELLGRKTSGRKQQNLPIIPNYLKNPPIFCSVRKHNEKQSCINQVGTNIEEVLLLKVRVADSSETDFIEIELQKSELTFNKLKEICSKELGIEPYTILKIRKLPNTIVRNNKDVQRLIDYQELEILQSTT